MMNHSDKEITELFNEKLPLLRQCDIVLFNSNENLIGLAYDNSKDLAPIIAAAYDGSFTYLFRNILKDYGIPCFESKLVVKGLSELYLGDEIPEKYYKIIAKYYSLIFKKTKTNSKIVEIAKSGLLALLQLVSNETGIEYEYIPVQTKMIVFLEKKEAEGVEQKRKYQICITYKEFLKNPAKFKEFIENPTVSCAMTTSVLSESKQKTIPLLKITSI